ncbi:MAG: BatD family protein, partial [Mucilaginibacter sp.]
MKYILILLSLVLSNTCYSQSLELKISTPQPRIGDVFSLSINVDTIASNVFNFLSPTYRVSPDKSQSNSESVITTNLQANKMGHNEIGPITLIIDNKTYISNKIKFDVIDSLPPTNKGVWIRTAPIDDSTVYIIIEQRIPASTYISHDSPNSISMTTKTNDDDDKEIEMIQDLDKINFSGSHSEMGRVNGPKNGTELKFENFFAL